MNGDGFSDVIVGARNYQSSTGGAFVYLGSTAGLPGSPQWTATGSQGGEYLGASVAPAGDINGDGFGDVLVGSPYFDQNWSDIGRASLFLGNGSLGFPTRLQQRRTDDSVPIAPLGFSDTQDSFRIKLSGRSPFGGGRARLQWEVKPLGTPFDGTGTEQSAAWASAGPSPFAFDELVDDLQPGAAYHWRARLVFDPTTTLFSHASRWFSGWWNGAQEADLAMPRATALSITMTDNPDPYVLDYHTAGITYTALISNAGPEPANVSVEDTLPPGDRLRFSDAKSGLL